MEYKVTRDNKGIFTFFQSEDPTLYEWKEFDLTIPVYNDLKEAIRLIQHTTDLFDLDPYLGMIERGEWRERLNPELKKFITKMKLR